MKHEPEHHEEPNLKARLFSLSLRLSILEFMHDDLSHRVDDAEEELDELWNSLGKLKRKQKILVRIIKSLLRSRL